MMKGLRKIPTTKQQRNSTAKKKFRNTSQLLPSLFNVSTGQSGYSFISALPKIAILAYQYPKINIYDNECNELINT